MLLEVETGCSPSQCLCHCYWSLVCEGAASTAAISHELNSSSAASPHLPSLPSLKALLWQRTSVSSRAAWSIEPVQDSQSYTEKSSLKKPKLYTAGLLGSEVR